MRDAGVDPEILPADLELGTERMAARPFVTPVIEEYRAGELGRAMKRYLQETGAW